MDRLLQAQLEDDPLLQKAAEWFIELRSDDVSGERIAEWQQWLAEAANRDAFGRVEALWRLIDGAAVHWPSEAEVTGDDYSGAQSVTAWRFRRERHAHPLSQSRLAFRRNWRGLRVAVVGAAAAAAVVIAAITYWPDLSVALQGGSRIAVATGVGGARTVSLPDGSVIFAGADTDLVATFLEKSRSVVLRHGEAYFHVLKNPTRPFVVRAGGTTVTDIGTAFDIRRTLSGVIVSVAEGEVKVATRLPRNHPSFTGPLSGSGDRPKLAAIQLTAGHRLSLESFNTDPQLSPVNPRWVAGWREGRLQYVDEPLNSVVADLTRYSDRRIVVASPGVASLRVTGVVFVQNINGWLASLGATFPVQVVLEADGTTVIERR